MRYLEIYRKFWRPFQSLLPKRAQRGAAWMAREMAGLRPSFDGYADFVDRAARDRELFWGGAMVFWDLMKDQCLNTAKLPPAEMSEAVCRSGLLPRSYYEADSFNVIRSFLEPFDKQYPGRDVLTRMIHTEFRLRLPELLLMRVDKVGMSVSLEARVPFLDHKLVEFSMDIPMEWKTRNGISKYLLKKAVEGLIPDELIYREKMGFGAPMSDWLKGSFGVHVQQVIGDSALIKRDYFNLEYINRLFEMHRRGHDTSTRIWVLFNLAAWYDCWIERRQARVA
jgi:asparagine synthase (glutamine-hydrolysing)